MSTWHFTKRLLLTSVAALLLGTYSVLPVAAQTYNCGTYGGGDYSECSTSSSAPASTSPSTSTSDPSPTNTDKELPEQKPAEDTDIQSTEEAKAAESSSVWKYVGIGFAGLLVLVAIFWGFAAWRNRRSSDDIVN